MYTESQSSITPHAGTHVTPPTSRCLSPAAAVQYRGGVYVLSSHPTCLLHSRYLSQVRTIDVQTIRCIASLNYKNHEPHRQQPPLSTNDRLPRKRLGAGNQSILGLVPNQELPATSTAGEPPPPSTIPPPPPSMTPPPLPFRSITETRSRRPASPIVIASHRIRGDICCRSVFHRRGTLQPSSTVYLSSVVSPPLFRQCDRSRDDDDDNDGGGCSLTRPRRGFKDGLAGIQLPGLDLMLSQVVFHGPTWKFPHSFGGCRGVLILFFYFDVVPIR